MSGSLVLLVLLGATSASAADAAAKAAAKKPLTTVTLELPTAVGLSYVPNYVGMQYGIFAKHGIKLTQQVIKPPTAVSLMEAGKLDAMGATGSAESASVHGTRLPTYVDEGIRQDFALIGAKGITSVKQLKGKVIAGESAIGAANQWEKAVLKSYGITTESFVTPGATAARAAYVEAGKATATVITTAQALQLQAQGYKILTYGNIKATELVAGGFAADPRWVNSHTKLVKNLVEAMIESTTFVVHNEAKTVKVLEGAPFNYAPTFAKTVYKDILPNWTPTGKAPKAAIDSQLKTLQLAYTLPKRPAATLVFTWRFVPES